MTNETCFSIVCIVIIIMAVIFPLAFVIAVNFVEGSEKRRICRQLAVEAARERSRREFEFQVRMRATSDARVLKFEQDAQRRAEHEGSHITLAAGLQHLSTQVFEVAKTSFEVRDTLRSMQARLAAAAKPTKKSKS